VLSEGFDAPHVDCVVLLRPTRSAGLCYQQVGRALRLAPGKTDCLVLDFAGNIAEHGPIDTIRPRRARAAGQPVTEGAPTRMCPECQEIVLASLRECPACGHAWPAPEPKHADTPSGIPVLSTWRAPERFRVERVAYVLHHKPGKPPSLRVDYHCGLRRFSEWTCFEHGGYARARAERWWARRCPPGERGEGPAPPGLPADTAAALALARAGALLAPATILVNLSGKYPEITRHELAPEPRAEAADARDPGAGPRDRASAA
jgi:DNA repair protein RadD